jgi:hypothetical protein
VLNTPLTDLRRRAPRLLTHAALVAYFAKRGLIRKIGIFGAFERGQIKAPPERFVQLWAAAVGASVEDVRAALAKTQRQRARQTGPFVLKESVRRPRPGRNSKKLLTNGTAADTVGTARQR